MFSPLAKLSTIRVLLSLQSINSGQYQLDVKNPSLNGDLEEVYVSSPPGFEFQFNHQVCELWKSLYGLKQSLRETLTIYCLRRDLNLGKLLCWLFTSMILSYQRWYCLISDDIAEITRLKRKMGDEFEIKDLGNLKYNLKMDVARSRERISVL